ncbi:hypothetical protein GLOTRDRAFT_141419 [Gloeophyllum trabeum ATCC 11539]|uniref:BTB domain-containing protein n=1 Tax=Gloeophyllum trabeum (strain ATCC 11539 / FP-39264 / Madison 617) TaxID=670483 RepID=S7PTH5_GLOTA|nr:uncharacterized protein GLOTRDRAFT_141419 [Gloeophyllum trabeum ATCC 11539]EPQ50617.1 hypothetical protein GLOTRDRAFT_141419 [Gloeophyllum trabeum ATCC 11539]
MEQINETANAVSSYRIRLDSHGKLTTSDESGSFSPLFSPVSSLGWRLGVMPRSVAAKGKKMKFHKKLSRYPEENYLDVYFDPSGVDISLGPLTIEIDVSVEGGMSSYPSPSTPSWTRVESEAQVALPSCTVEVGSWRMDGCDPNALITVRCTVTLGALSTASITGMKQPAIVSRFQSGLESSIHTGNFIDTRFFVFSRRDRSGKRAPYFDTLLSADGFSESVEGILGSQFPANEQPSTDNYDYESDSDLEDDLEEDGPEKSDAAAVEGEGPVDGDMGQVNGKTGLDKEFENLLEQDTSRASDSCTKTVDIPGRVHGLHGPLGRTIVVKDTALRTFTALLRYFYVGDINFAPLKSQHVEVIQDINKSLNETHPSCSPKSMYRLADKLDLQDLKNKSFEALRCRLSKDNIVEEAFSKFTWTYDEVRDMEVEALCKFCKSADGDEVMDKVKQFMSTAPVEDFRRSMELVSLLLPLLVQREGTATLPTSSLLHPVPTSPF